ncbi:polymorphic toxin type 4 domain-containing protein [Micromonospora sp. NPDC049679]|uniref:polymorphic toxin type 4 domain-containing protein n=1 Tax=Micromonospora sp. NPDC049679 TaxID=3155920 RepID=UPI0033E91E22
MAITAAMVRAGMQRWAREQSQTLEAIQRALTIVYRERPGSRSVDDLAHALLLAVANQHERRLDGALGQLDGALGRLLDDMEMLRGAAGEGRAPAMREADLHIVADALAEMSTFEDRVRFMLDQNATDVQSTMRDLLTAGTGAPTTSTQAAVTGGASPAALAAAREVPPLARSRSRGRELLDWAGEIVRAWQDGRTLEPAGVASVRVGWPDHPVLVEQMQRMRNATEAYRAVMAGQPSPAAAARAADDLQRVIAESNEVLRSFGRRFDSGPSRDRVPPSRPIPAGGTHEPGSAAADALAVRSRAGALVEPSASATEISEALRFDDVRATATGVLSEPLSRDLPGMGLQGYTLGGRAVRALPTSPAWLADRLANMVAGWQRAHLVGPGFGGEVFAGLMLAPWGVNQLAQNKGAEHVLRQLAAAERATGATASVAPVVTAQGRRLAIPLTNGAFEFIDVLTSVRYEIPRPGGPPLHIDIHVNSDGSWRVSHDLPAGVWPDRVPLTGTR